jgi:hypothetical protein
MNTSSAPLGGARRRRPGLVSTTALTLAALLGPLAGSDLLAQAGGSLRAGAATANVTPWLGLSINGHMSDRKAAHIHDELHARALVLDDGARRLAVVVCDSCMLPLQVSDRAKERIEKTLGLPRDRVLIAATHSHSCPTATGVFQSDSDERYLDFLTLRIADAVAIAANRLAPARLGSGSGSLPGQVFNRRWFMKPGAIPPDPFGGTTDRVRMNPPRASPDLLEPAGPTDPEVPVVYVTDASSKPLALLGNYALHYVGGFGPAHVSADYFGYFARGVEELLGARGQEPPFVALLSNGTSGDINNIDFRRSDPGLPPYAQMKVVAADLAAEAVRVARALKPDESITLDAVEERLELAVRRPSHEEVEAANRLLEAAKGRELTKLDEIYARETVLLADYPPKVELVLQALRIGDLAVVAIPCEVFVEIGLELKKKSPFRATFVIELANGYNGYLPTVEHHKLGGYETWRARSSYLEVEAAPKITAKLIEMLGVLAARR